MTVFVDGTYWCRPHQHKVNPDEARIMRGGRIFCPLHNNQLRLKPRHPPEYYHKRRHNHAAN